MSSPITSSSVAELAKALSKAQGEMKHATKDKNNPFFKSKYADLASVWDVCREVLSKNGLSVSQPIIYENEKILLKTILFHSSGEFIESTVPIIGKSTLPQDIGSAITYMRRFSLSSIVGVAADDEDDDGNHASGRIIPQNNYQKKIETKPKENKTALESPQNSERFSGDESKAEARTASNNFPLSDEVLASEKITLGRHAGKKVKELSRIELEHFVKGISTDAALKGEVNPDIRMAYEEACELLNSAQK